MKMMKKRPWCSAAAVAVAFGLMPGCGSSSGDSADDAATDYTQAPMRSRGGASDSHTPGRGASDTDPATQTPSPTPGQPRDGSHRLAEDLNDMIETLVDGSGEDFIEAHVDPYTLSQVKVHNATFPERESLKKLYEGFEEGVAHDLLIDLRRCRDLTPEIVAQDDGWFAAIYDDESLTAEVILAYDPQDRASWFLIELPLTTPWGTAQSASRQWEQWLEEVDAASGRGARGRDHAAVDPHLNPAAALYAVRGAFGVEPGRVKHDIATYAALLRPESRRLVAAILFKRLIINENITPHVDEFRAMCVAHGMDREGTGEIRSYPSEDRDLAFYQELAERFPDEQAGAFIVDAEALLTKVTGNEPALLYPGGTWQNPQPREAEGGVLVHVGWGYTHDRFRRGPMLDVLLVEIDGKWYVESYWEAAARNGD